MLPPLSSLLALSLTVGSVCSCPLCTRLLLGLFAPLCISGAQGAEELAAARGLRLLLALSKQLDHAVLPGSCCGCGCSSASVVDALHERESVWCGACEAALLLQVRRPLRLVLVRSCSLLLCRVLRIRLRLLLIPRLLQRALLLAASALQVVHAACKPRELLLQILALPYLLLQRRLHNHALVQPPVAASSHQ